MPAFWALSGSPSSSGAAITAFVWNRAKSAQRCRSEELRPGPFTCWTHQLFTEVGFKGAYCLLHLGVPEDDSGVSGGAGGAGADSQRPSGALAWLRDALCKSWGLLWPPAEGLHVETRGREAREPRFLLLDALCCPSGDQRPHPPPARVTVGPVLAGRAAGGHGASGRWARWECAHTRVWAGQHSEPFPHGVQPSAYPQRPLAHRCFLEDQVSRSHHGTTKVCQVPALFSPHLFRGGGGGVLCSSKVRKTGARQRRRPCPWPVLLASVTVACRCPGELAWPRGAVHGEGVGALQPRHRPFQPGPFADKGPGFVSSAQPPRRAPTPAPGRDALSRGTDVRLVPVSERRPFCRCLLLRQPAGAERAPPRAGDEDGVTHRELAVRSLHGPRSAGPGARWPFCTRPSPVRSGPRAPEAACAGRLGGTRDLRCGWFLTGGEAGFRPRSLCAVLCPEGVRPTVRWEPVPGRAPLSSKAADPRAPPPAHGHWSRRLSPHALP